jgi:hypothetical protein
MGNPLQKTIARGASSSAKHASPEEQFWVWFAAHEAELFDFEANREKVFDRVQEALNRIDDDLTFEFGPKNDGEGGAMREFVVSADGIKRAFPAVISLCKVAPRMKKWTVTAFRPRRWPLNEIEYGGKQISSEDVQVTLLDNGRIAGIHLFFPGYEESDSRFRAIGYLMLDEALGEFDVETRVGLIKMSASEEPSPFSRIPLAKLPVAFDRLVARLEVRDLRPH